MYKYTAYTSSEKYVYSEPNLFMGDKVCVFYKQMVRDVSVMTSCRLTSYVRIHAEYPFVKSKMAVT